MLTATTVFGNNIDIAQIAVGNIAADLIECNNGNNMITIDATVLAAAIVEAIASHNRGYMEVSLNRNEMATQIIDSVLTHLDD